MINLNVILIIISFIINIQLSLLNINHLYFIPLSIITLNQFLQFQYQLNHLYQLIIHNHL